MVTRTGASSTTPENMLLGAGILEIKATSGGSFVKIGATRGGFTFNPGIPLRSREFDGSQGNTKGMVVKDKGNPTMTGTILEISKTNLQQLIPGSQLVDDTITSRGQISDDDYLYQIRWTGYRSANTTDTVVITMDNVLCTEPLPLTTADNDEATIAVTLTGHFDLDAVETTDGYSPEPWSITSTL